LNAAGAAGFIAGPVIGWFYEISPFLPYAFGAGMMIVLLTALYISPVLRHAGNLPGRGESLEEGAETPIGG
jgi:hypothetical protein